MLKRLFALTLSVLFLFACMPVLAEPARQERVYVVAGPDGTVKSLSDIIRLTNPDKLDTLTEKTMLDQIRNIGGDESFTQDGGTLVFDADGHEITYEGTSDKVPAVLPEAVLTLDGQVLSFDELSQKEGSAELTVSYPGKDAVPALAITLLPLPQSGVTDLTLENATLLSEMGRQFIVGWAVPGADPELSLPDHFRVSFTASHAKLDYMMTLCTSDPIDRICQDIDSRISLDLHKELDEALSVVLALKDGKTLPETTGKTSPLVSKVNALNQGLCTLDDGAAQLQSGTASLESGASQLADGSKQLSEGATALMNGAETLSQGVSDAESGAGALSLGLNTLTQSSSDLTQGSGKLFDAILDTASQTLAASGLEQAGFTVPSLTQENYAEVLSQLLSALDPESLSAQAKAEAEKIVRPKVESGTEQIQKAVTQAIEPQVLEAVLQAAHLSLNAEQYAASVQDGTIDRETAAAIDQAVQAQMASEEVQAKVTAAVQDKIEELVAENVEKALQSDKDVQAKLSAAEQAFEKIRALKAQLDQVKAFNDGVTAYTEGVSQAADGAQALASGLVTLKEGAKTLHKGSVQVSQGAGDLKDGLSTLKDGAADLSKGAKALHENGTSELKSQLLDAQSQAAEALLPYLQEDLPKVLHLFEDTRDRSADAGYDLRSGSQEETTLYLIRTDLAD